MAIIFQVGEEFWIESHFVFIIVPDAAGATSSGAINLDRPGDFLGGVAIANNSATNDNAQAVGAVMLTDATPSALTFGESLTQFQVRITKLAGTAGNTQINIMVTLFLRKSRG